MRNTFKTYIYVLGLQNEINSAKSRVHQGHIYMSLAHKGLNVVSKQKQFLISKIFEGLELFLYQIQTADNPDE